MRSAGGGGWVVLEIPAGETVDRVRFGFQDAGSADRPQDAFKVRFRWTPGRLTGPCHIGGRAPARAHRFLRRVRAQDRTRGRVVPVWAPVLFVACTIVLVPWTVLLVIELPDRQVARHWDLAWGGLDVGIAAALLATASTVARRSVWTPVAAAVTGTLLVVDAWFDVVTAADRSDRLVAIAMALVVELPLAGVCLFVARNVERVLEQARRYALAAGYRVEGRSLVAPPGPPAPHEQADVDVATGHGGAGSPTMGSAGRPAPGTRP